MSVTSSSINPTPGQSLNPRARATLLAFATGLALALLQFSYFFLLEAYLTSRASSFFVALFFWLIGFLAGLNLRSDRAFPVLAATAPLAYYVALTALSAFPYRLELLAPVGGCIAVSGMLAGAFFPFAARRFTRVKSLLLHENNGFIVGLLLVLMLSIFHGRLLLVAAPAAGIALWHVAGARTNSATWLAARVVGLADGLRETQSQPPRRG